MNSRNTRIALSAASTLAIAGLAAAATAQTDTQQTQQERQPYGTEPAQPRAGTMNWEFRNGSELLGMDVEDGTGETIATINDLIFERGSGRITHAVLSAGGVLGIGDKEFAVPYDRLQFNPGAGEGAFGGDEPHFTTNVSRDDIEQAPEFRPEEWANLDHTDWWEETKGWFDENNTLDDAVEPEPMDRDDSDLLDRDDGAIDEDRDDEWRRDQDEMGQADQEDPYAQKIREGERQELRGTVKSVDRQEGDGKTIIEVETEQGETKTVLLGPSWYVMTQEGTPYRGDQIMLEVCQIDGGEADFVACKSMDPTKDYTLRDEQGRPSWASAGAQRLMLMSDIVGAEATLPTRDETGDIEDVVVEAENGQIVLVALDANENFLGVGDDLKAVPWPVVRVVSSDTVRIDATEEMLNSSQEVPDRLADLASPTELEPIYMIYEVEVIEVRRTAGADQALPDQALAQGDPIEALRSGEEVTISGEVIDVSAKTVAGFDSEMMVATIDDDGESKEVILGSKSYFDRNPIMVSVGDEVSIQAKSADIDGEPCLAATTLDANGQETALWSGDRPLWEDE